MMPDIDMKTVRASAEQWYAKLLTSFTLTSGDNDFWRLGNCFDTMTDYLLISGAAGTDGMLRTVQEKFMSVPLHHDQRDTVDTWYDDWAWWAIAAAKAYDPLYAEVFGTYGRAYTGIAQACWSVVDQGLGDGVHLGAPHAYTNLENQTLWVNPPKPLEGWVKPRIDAGRGSGLHGTWQYDIFSNERTRPNTPPADPAASYWAGPAEGNPDTNPSWPSSTWAGPFQLTVMNGLYLLLAGRLERAHRSNPGVPSTALQLRDEYGFLKAWFGEDPHNPVEPEASLLRRVKGGWVVGERVSTYAARDGKYEHVENWLAQATWGGDIGLIVNGLATYHELFPDDTLPARLVQGLVFGYIGRLYSHTEGPRAYYPSTGGIFAGDTGDYKSGIGVFMRGLLQAYKQEHSPISDLVEDGTFRQFLTGCCDWAMRQPIDPPKTKPDSFDCLNVLATLTAVMAILSS
jgi:hypothetical protein